MSVFLFPLFHFFGYIPLFNFKIRRIVIKKKKKEKRKKRRRIVIKKYINKVKLIWKKKM